MRPDDRDLALLRDMQAACAEIGEFIKGVNFDRFTADRMRCLAVERSLEIVGEAAGRVSAGLQRECPQIPWRTIKGLRNILAHEYGQVEYPALFKTACEDVPVLLLELERQIRLRASGK